MAFVKKVLGYRDTYLTHLQLPLRTGSDTTVDAATPIIREGMLMIPKVDRVNAPYISEYHHMDLLDFSYYHPCADCKFRNVMCKSNECTLNKVSAVLECLRLKPGRMTIITRANQMINQMEHDFPHYYCDCDHYTTISGKQKKDCLKIPLEHEERVRDHSQPLPKEATFVSTINLHIPSDCQQLPPSVTITKTAC